jgi:hypothetical protein
MQESTWTVRSVNKAMVPDWEISCLACVGDRAPIVCADERQARSWASKHHTTNMTTVRIRWNDSYPGALWVYPVFADFIVQSALRLPVGLGVETGNGGLSGWATGLYGEPPSAYDEEVLEWLGAAVVDQAARSPFTFDIARVVVEPISPDEFQEARMMSSYVQRTVGWK